MTTADQGRLNIARHVAWRHVFRDDWRRATGIDLEPLEREPFHFELHERVPLAFILKTVKEPRMGEMLDFAYLATENQRSLAVVIERRSWAPGYPGARGVLMQEEDWRELLELFEAAPPPPNLVAVRKDSRVAPRLWEGLLEAQRHARDTYPVGEPVALCLGYREEGANVVLVDYDGFLRLAGELYRRKLL